MFINAIRKAILTASRTSKANSKGNSHQRINNSNDSRNRHRPGSSPQPINSSKGRRNKEVRSNKWNGPTRTGAPGHRITIDPAHRVIVEQADLVEEAVAVVVAGEGKSLIILGM